MSSSQTTTLAISCLCGSICASKARDGRTLPPARREARARRRRGGGGRSGVGARCGGSASAAPRSSRKTRSSAKRMPKVWTLEQRGISRPGPGPLATRAGRAPAAGRESRSPPAPRWPRTARRRRASRRGAIREPWHGQSRPQPPALSPAGANPRSGTATHRHGATMIGMIRHLLPLGWRGQMASTHG